MGSTEVTGSRSPKKSDPLLPTSIQGVSGRCGACSNLFLLFIPILGCSLVLAALYLLTYRLEVQITETSISSCLANYEPKLEVLVVIAAGATLMFVVTMMRNIQINVYHRRQGSESTAMRVLNYIATMSNILAYIGFILLAVFDVDDPNPFNRVIHYVGSVMYFTLAGLYGLLQTYLLCKQRQYPMFCNIVFTMVCSAAIVSSIIYISNLEENFELEWFAVALHAIYVGLMSLLFHVDPVDDELRDFFCCRHSQRK
jgi:hypothetical protein